MLRIFRRKKKRSRDWRKKQRSNRSQRSILRKRLRNTRHSLMSLNNSLVSLLQNNLVEEKNKLQLMKMLKMVVHQPRQRRFYLSKNLLLVEEILKIAKSQRKKLKKRSMDRESL
jgi:hypothetical protein